MDPFDDPTTNFDPVEFQATHVAPFDILKAAKVGFHFPLPSVTQT